MKTKHWIILIAIVAAAVLLYFLLKEPKPIDSHKDDYDRIIAENKSFKEKETVALKRIDSLESAGKGKDSAIASLKTELTATRRQLDKTTITATKLAKEVKELSKNDTTPLGRKCDSLAEEAQNFAFLYGQYKQYADSLSTVIDSRNEDYVKALEEQRKLYDELKRKYDELFAAYTELFKDLKSLNKTIRRERLKTKIAALIGLIGGAAAVLK